MTVIEYKGETLRTKHRYPVSNELQEELKRDYYSKPDISSVRKNIQTLSKGGVMKTNINNYYFKHIWSKVVFNHSKWSIEDVFESKDLLGYFIAKSKTNDKVFPKNKPLIDNVETALRLGGKGIASKPSQFPVKVVKELLKDYNVKDYHDYCAGWGDRLVGALSENVNYYATDVNYLLVDELKSLTKEWKNTVENESLVDIRLKGSETYIHDWENTMDFSFSSPPYFDLEDYKIGNQSFTKGMGYDTWLDTFLVPTIHNAYKYLKPGGHFAINVNNVGDHDLVQDAYDIAVGVGLELVEERDLKNIKRTNSNGGFNDNSERILVFAK